MIIAWFWNRVGTFDLKIILVLVKRIIKMNEVMIVVKTGKTFPEGFWALSNQSYWQLNSLVRNKCY